MASTRGPIPKRSDQRRRRNVTPGLEQAPAAAAVKIPPASRDWHPIARDWYRSLKASGQSRYYEPSDWATARYFAELMSMSLQSGDVNASLISAIINGSRDLMTTEGQRRRVSLELTRAATGADDEASEARDRVAAVISIAGA